MRALPAGVVTFLFSDIEGSTRLLGELGAEQYAHALAAHRRQMREAFAAHGGVEVDTQGDAFFVAFGEAQSALAAAATAQRALAAGPIRVRIGIHTGEPLVTREGYVGIDVHRGARIMSAGHGGQVLVSEASYAMLDGEDDLSDLGLHRLKDLTEPQRLWQLGDGEFPPLKTLYQTNLPVQPTPLVGREAELECVVELLRTSRLVTLTGAGGTGKTRLALQAAAELVDQFPDGVWWVSLAALRDPELVEPTIAQVVGATDGLVDHLRSSKVLLLLDNFEQLLDSAPRLGAVLSEAPQLHVLATSRERLALGAEHEYAVPTMVSMEAVALFTARARQLKPDFQPDDAVTDICARLDGLPLAIELAAARIKVLEPAQILDRLGRSLDLLTTGVRDAPERHRTLRATIGWSYDLLSEPERRLFMRLAVFPGSYSVQAAETVCDADPDSLGALVEKSLLRKTADGRFFMLETISEYASERLEESGEAAEIKGRHVNYFTETVERLDSFLLGPAEGGAFDELAAEHENLRAALRFTIDSGNPKGALRLATSGVQRFWRIRGHLTEGRRWLEEALAQSGVDAKWRAKGLRAVANIAGVAGDSEAVVAAAEEALSTFRALGDLPNAIDCLNALGGAAMRSGDLASARARFEEVEELASQIGDTFRLEAALENLGNVALYEGHYDRAQRLFEQGLELTRELALPEATAHAILNSGLTALLMTDYVRAESLFQEGLELAAATGSVADVVYGCAGLAAALAGRAEWNNAVKLFAAADRIGTSIGLELEVLERRVHDRALALARSNLPADDFDSAWAAGEAMEVEELVSL